MSTRISSALALACALAACQRTPPDPAPGKLTTGIDCALGGASEFSAGCKLDRVEPAQLVIYHPDGAFRRIDVAPDGSLSAADGADPISGTPREGGGVELAVGSDRYRLPPRR